MNKRFIISAALIIFLFSNGFTCCPPVFDTPLNAVQIADSFIRLYPDTIAYPAEAKSYKWNYEQGLMLEAFYRMWKITGDNKYYDYLKKNIDYYIEDNGEIKTYKIKDYNLDNVSPGRILLHMFAETKNIKYKTAADTLRAQLKQQPRTPSGGFWHKKVYPGQMWLDGLFMAEPFYTMYSEMFSENNYDDIAKQFLLIQQHLKDEKTGLYFHGWDETKEQAWADKVTGRSPSIWGRAMGWLAMALVDVLDHFPQDHTAYPELKSMFSGLCTSLLNFRDPQTKLWYQVVDKGGKEGNYIEASASAMYIYAFARGANKGYLDKTFLEYARGSYRSLAANMVTIKDNNIYLNDVVSVGGLGGKPYRDGSYEYYLSEPKRVNDFKGYGPFLLAAIELK